MTFRGRLRIFFAIIVIVPMVAIGVALLSLTASSERGKTDASLATALTVAFSAYDDARTAANDDLRRVARDPELTAALARGDRRAAARRLSEIAAGRRIVSVTLTQPAFPRLRAGSRRGVASARAELNGRTGGSLGTLSVSVTDARDLARTVGERSGQELLVLRGGRAVATTVPSVRTAPKGSGDFEVAEDEYRGRRERVAAAEELVIFTDATELNDSISENRLLVIGLLVGLLILALASTVFVSRALGEQIGRVPRSGAPAGERPLRPARPGHRKRRVRAARPRVQPHVGAARGQDRRGGAPAARAGDGDSPGGGGIGQRA